MYQNNPDLVLSKEVDLSLDESSLKENIFEILQVLVPEALTLASSQDVRISKLTGGITNSLLLVEWDSEDVKNTVSIIVRVFGQGTETIIDRRIENIVFSSLSKLQRLQTPIFYGLFTNGRIEGYIPNAITCEPKDLSDSHLMPSIAEAAAVFHGIKLDNIPPDIVLWQKIDRFFDFALNASFDNASENEKFQALRLNHMKDEYDAMKSYIRHISSRTDGSKSWQLGQEFAMQNVLCHNDLLCGNILYHETVSERPPSSNEITLIDYEYCGYNYLAYDLANHFCEYCGFEYNIDLLPTLDQRKRFLISYVTKWIENSEGLSASNSEMKLSLTAIRAIPGEWEDFLDGFVVRSYLYFCINQLPF
jgi:thiamine kinase-like enzyme